MHPICSNEIAVVHLETSSTDSHRYALIKDDIVTDLINALPGDSSVNMIQHATIEEAVFAVSAVTSRSGGWWSRDICFL
jgi:hypothetical protein